MVHERKRKKKHENIIETRRKSCHICTEMICSRYSRYFSNKMWSFGFDSKISQFHFFFCKFFIIEHKIFYFSMFRFWGCNFSSKKGEDRENYSTNEVKMTAKKIQRTTCKSQVVFYPSTHFFRIVKSDVKKTIVHDRFSRVFLKFFSFFPSI